MIEVRIDNYLRVRKADLPIGHEQQIKQRLTIANGEKAAARKRRQWGAEDLPDSFVLYEDVGPLLIMPRGFATELEGGMKLSGYEIRWSDQTSLPQLPLHKLVLNGPTLREDQEKACQALLQARQGVLHSPTGGGKTVVILEAWRRIGTTGLILVEKASLARQWRDRALEHLGVETGMIGEGEWDERPLTVATMQTLHRREISDVWWQRWGMVSIDEAHHAPAETFQRLLQRVCSRYFFGKTATPLEDEWTQPFLTRTIGPIAYITTPETLRRAGVRVTPIVQRVHTRWHWVPANARDEALVDTKVIYRRILDALKGNLARVDTIAQTIANQPPECAQLVVCKSLDYLDHIAAAVEVLGYEGDILMYRGSESPQVRAEVAERADEGSCVILATVADEGIDIPRLDRLHLVWPQRKERVITQQVGRILRTHPDKRGCVIIDYVDDEGMLANQAKVRLGVYRRAGYAVDNVTPTAA
jgi:superfamily II DNA or RNA helicase